MFADATGILMLAGVVVFVGLILGYLWYTRNDPFRHDEDDPL